MKPSSVKCFWKYIPPKDASEPYKRLWKLVEAIPCDGDGYLAKTPTSFEPFNSRHSWEAWMNKKKKLKGEDYEYVPIMGRAITCWNPLNGVTLMDLHPPEWVPWLSIQFLTELRKLPNWFSFLEDGGTLYLGTARAVEDIFSGTGTNA